MDNPQISVILATIQRSIEIEYFLHKLQEQHYKEVEVIIVDQNRDDRSISIINQFSDPIAKIRYRGRSATCFLDQRIIKPYCGFTEEPVRISTYHVYA